MTITGTHVGGRREGGIDHEARQITQSFYTIGCEIITCRL